MFQTYFRSKFSIKDLCQFYNTCFTLSRLFYSDITWILSPSRSDWWGHKIAIANKEEIISSSGRILRPKRNGSIAHFYSIVTRDSRNQEFVINR